MYTAHTLYTELKDLKNVVLIVFDNNIAHFYVGIKSGSKLMNDKNVKGRIYLSNSLNATFCITEFDDFLKYLKNVNEPIFFDKENLVVTTPNREFEFVVDELPPKEHWPTFPYIQKPETMYKNLNLKIEVPYDIMRFEEEGTFVVSLMGHKKRINKNKHKLYTEVKRETLDRLPRFTYDYSLTLDYLYLQYKEPLTGKAKIEFYLTNDLMVTDDDIFEVI